jgi:hypothetical protein
MGDMADLRRLPQNVGDQTVKNLNVVGHAGPFAMVSDEIDAHLVGNARAV